MSTAPRPGSHLSAPQNTPDKLRVEVEPLVAELLTVSNDVTEIERLTDIAELAHRILSERLASDEVR